MRSAELNPLYPCVAAIDVHQSKLTVCVLHDDEKGKAEVHLRDFGGFKRDRRAMAEWITSFGPLLVVMESTGIYWKSPYAELERHGLNILVVNARHVKQVPGRKTDIRDAQWLAILARSGLLKIVFVLIQRGEYYRDASIDYEALNVARNAPRWLRMLKKYGFLQAKEQPAV
jgi:transposase